MTRVRPALLAGSLALLGALLLPLPGSGQAWLPPKGEVSYFFAYGNIWNTKHYASTGDEVDAGHTRSATLTLGAGIALSDRLFVSASLPWVDARYHGSRPHPGSEIDDGDYHSAFQDLRVEARYQALTEPFALAPFVAGSWPVENYETLGHAAVGKGLDEYTVGFYAGRSLDDWIPYTYLQARYGYTFAEKVAGVFHDHSAAGLEVGYFVTDRISLSAFGSWKETHGGVDLPVPVTDPLYPYHDQLGRESFLNLGVGAAYALFDRLDLLATYSWSVRGKNSHKLDDGLSFAVSYRCPCAFRQLGEAAARP